jgi:hypothetical protein
MPVAGKQCEAGDEKPFRYERTRDGLPSEKSPRLAAVTERESEDVRKIGEAIATKLLKVLRDRDAVVDILLPQTTVEPRNANGIVHLEVMRRNVWRLVEPQNGSRRSGRRDADERPGSISAKLRFADAFPRLRMHSEQDKSVSQIMALEFRSRIGLEDRCLVVWNVDRDEIERRRVALRPVGEIGLGSCGQGAVGLRALVHISLHVEKRVRAAFDDRLQFHTDRQSGVALSRPPDRCSVWTNA